MLSGVYSTYIQDWCIIILYTYMYNNYYVPYRTCAQSINYTVKLEIFSRQDILPAHPELKFN